MRILYLSYTGVLEPLGMSQVLSYLCRLSIRHRIQLVSFERHNDIVDRGHMTEVAQTCKVHGIRWTPCIYRKRPRILATAFNMARLLFTALRGRQDLIHARGYVTAAVAWVAHKLTGSPYIFDMRALWVDELVLAGRLERNSILHRTLTFLERRLLRDAAHTVSLTEAAVVHLDKKYPGLRRGDITVIPTCVDTSRFDVFQRRPSSSDFVLGSVGSVASGWFPVESLAELYAAGRRARGSLRLVAVTRDDPTELRQQLAIRGCDDAQVTIAEKRPSEIPAAMADMTAGVVLNYASVGRLGSLPTRMGEFLACGVPVIGNRGVGDVAMLIEKFRVGVVIDDLTNADYSEVWTRLLSILEDPNLGVRCRNAAESYFSLDRGVERYDSIYRQAGN